MAPIKKKRRPKSKNYFTQDTENAIVKYNNEPDSKIRSTIYQNEIHFPFFKLTQNIIHTFTNMVPDFFYETITNYCNLCNPGTAYCSKCVVNDWIAT